MDTTNTPAAEEKPKVRVYKGQLKFSNPQANHAQLTKGGEKIAAQMLVVQLLHEATELKDVQMAYDMDLVELRASAQIRPNGNYFKNTANVDFKQIPKFPAEIAPPNTPEYEKAPARVAVFLTREDFKAITYGAEIIPGNAISIWSEVPADAKVWYAWEHFKDASAVWSPVGLVEYDQQGRIKNPQQVAADIVMRQIEKNRTEAENLAAAKAVKTTGEGGGLES